MSPAESRTVRQRKRGRPSAFQRPFRWVLRFSAALPLDCTVLGRAGILFLVNAASQQLASFLQKAVKRGLKFLQKRPVSASCSLAD